MIQNGLQHKKLSVAYLLGRFPELYERVLLEEIVAVAHEGVDARIVARKQGDASAPAGFADLLKEAVFLDLAGAFGPLVSGCAGLVRAFASCVASPKMMALLHVHLHAEGCFRGAEFWRRVRLACLLKREKPHLIHAQVGSLGLLAAPVCEFLSIPLVVTCCGEDVQWLGRCGQRMRAQFFEQVNSLVVRSNNVLSDLESMGCPKEKIIVFPLSVDVSSIPFDERKYPGPKGVVSILMAGRLVARNGMDDALVAVAEAVMSCNRLTVRIAGDGPELSRLQRYVSSLDLRERVTFLGAISYETLVKEMMAAHLFMLPCRDGDEGCKNNIPNTIKEAMASGLPVLSTQQVGIAECVENHENGLLVREGDASALADALLEMLAVGERWPAMSRAGRKILEDRFDVRELAPRLVRHYHSIMQD